MSISGYFKPCRRKLGVVTLVLACSIMGMWIRGRFKVDSIYFLHRDFVSEGNGINFVRFVPKDPNLVYFEIFPIRSSTYAPHWDSYENPSNLDHWSFRRFGFGYNERYSGWGGSRGDETFQTTLTRQIWRVPYWSIVIPLTLTSAWLLLSKPRANKPKPDSEP